MTSRGITLTSFFGMLLMQQPLKVFITTNLAPKKNDLRLDLGAAGSTVEWRTKNGIIREEILKTGCMYSQTAGVYVHSFSEPLICVLKLVDAKTRSRTSKLTSGRC